MTTKELMPLADSEMGTGDPQIRGRHLRSVATQSSCTRVAANGTKRKGWDTKTNTSAHN